MSNAEPDPRHGGHGLGLPSKVRACLFDLGGVLTQTTRMQAAAWKTTFDAFLRARAARTGEPFVPFDVGTDYAEYVDGKPRHDGVRAFLAARRIELPGGRLDDPPAAETIGGLANQKNELFLALVRERGVETCDGSIRYVIAARAAGLTCAVVSASANAREVLEAAGIAHLFAERLDGIDAERMDLKAKPAPDTFLAAARALWVFPGEAAVFEDAPAGVAAARAGSIGYIVGIDRSGNAQALREQGADVVVSDLADLLQAR